MRASEFYCQLGGLVLGVTISWYQTLNEDTRWHAHAENNATHLINYATCNKQLGHSPADVKDGVVAIGPKRRRL